MSNTLDRLRWIDLCLVALIVTSSCAFGAEPIMLNCSGTLKFGNIDAPSDAYKQKNDNVLYGQNLLIEDSQLSSPEDETPFPLCKTTAFSKVYSNSCSTSIQQYISNFQTVSDKLDYDSLFKIPLSLKVIEIDRLTLEMKSTEITGYIRTSFIKSKPQWKAWFHTSDYLAKCSKVKPVL